MNETTVTAVVETPEVPSFLKRLPVKKVGYAAAAVVAVTGITLVAKKFVDVDVETITDATESTA